MDEGATLSPSSSFSSCSSTRNYKYDEQTLYTSCSGRQRTNERTNGADGGTWMADKFPLCCTLFQFKFKVCFLPAPCPIWKIYSGGVKSHLKWSTNGWMSGWVANELLCHAGQRKHSHLIILFTKSPVNCKSTVNWCNWWMEKRTSMPAVGVVVILFMQFNCH